MIGSLRGQLTLLTADSAVIECGGVGYEIYASINTIAELQSQLSKEVFVSVYTHVREEALSLFGFTDKTEKQLFMSLLKVNGIGPKMALHILSGSTTQNIINMIENEDVKALTNLPKVGRKTAEQMILALKGKLAKSEAPDKSAIQGPRQEMTFALINLGFRPLDVEKVVKSLPSDIELQEGIRQSLAALTSL